ncbi:MAG: uroporphyrinogen decarboxylase family protein [Cyclobacteriaceae bacterium]|nr:uroporphyrinogen decarboxylase family protein [Cyclobacteriaceae bacterium]
MNINNWAKQLINQDRRMAIPIMTHPGIEMIGKKISDAVQCGATHAAAIKKLNEVYPVAATSVIMDLTVEAEAFGALVEIQEDEMPHLLGRLVSSADEIERLKVPDLYAGRIQEYIKANRITVQTNIDKPVFSGVIGPFSLAGRLYDMSEIMVACYTEPDAVGTLLEKCTEFLTNYCSALKEVGCLGVLIAEPAAGLLSNEDCMLFSSKYIKSIVDAVQDDEFMVILHNCGKSALYRCHVVHRSQRLSFRKRYRYGGGFGSLSS